ncbi:MAG: type II secretion system protein GspE, partial [Deefgea sp.]
MSIVSYPFAREFGVFDGEIHDGTTPIVMRQGGSIAAMGELRRKLGQSRLLVLAEAEFNAKLTQHFNNSREGKASAMNMVDDIEESADLARLIQDMPEISDL